MVREDLWVLQRLGIKIAVVVKPKPTQNANFKSMQWRVKSVCIQILAIAHYATSVITTAYQCGWWIVSVHYSDRYLYSPLGSSVNCWADWWIKQLLIEGKPVSLFYRQNRTNWRAQEDLNLWPDVGLRFIPANTEINLTQPTDASIWIASKQL